MMKYKKEFLKKVLVIFIIQCLFLFWEHSNRQIYPTTGIQIKDLQNYLSGFCKFDKKCMVWIILHFPIQFYISLKHLDFFNTFSALYFIRNGKIRNFFCNYYKLYGKIPVIYYFIGFLTIALKNAVSIKNIEQMKGIIGFIVVCSLILGITSLIFSAYVFLFTICFKRYQIGLCITFMMEMLMIIFFVGFSEEIYLLKNLRIPLCGTIIGFLTNSVWDHQVLILTMIEFLIIAGVNCFVYRFNFEKVYGIEEG